MASPGQPPHWEHFAPPSPTGIGRLFKSGHQRATVQARSRFEQELALYQEREADRLAALAEAERRHEQAEQSRRQQVDQHNAQVDRLEQGVTAGVPQAVEDYVELLIEASPLPDDLPVDVDVAYQPEARKLLVIRELPGVAIIPEAREYSYVRSRDEIAAKPRPAKEIRQRYASLVAQLVLRTMREVFEVRPTTLIDEVAVDGHVSTRGFAEPQAGSDSASRWAASGNPATTISTGPAECAQGSRHFAGNDASAAVTNPGASPCIRCAAIRSAA